MSLTLDSYRLLGRSGLRVSPLALGAAARTPTQPEDNLGALEVTFTSSQIARLDEASAIDLGYPHALLAVITSAT